MAVATNPFDVTKATDYNDEEIESNFVSFAAGASSLVNPADPMPTFLIGGKGGGRTHLLRHFAFAQQRMRALAGGVPILSQLREEGYLGVYVRFTGLNADRFNGKGIADDAWKAIYAYYVDLWLAQNLLIALNEIQAVDSVWSAAAQEAFVEEFESSFDLRRTPTMFDIASDRGPLDAALESMTEELRGFDQAMNRAALTRKIDVDIRSAPGKTIFAASRAVGQLDNAADLRITFMLDEFENLTEWQQEYINSLIRDKELPTTFLVGSRRWGIKTRGTWSAGEENKVGSEFAQIVLEDTYRESKKEYERFCRDIVLRRVQQLADSIPALARVETWFGEPEHSSARALEVAERTLFKYAPENRPYLAALRTQIRNKADGNAIARHLAVPKNPIVEKLALREFYGDWKRRGSPSARRAVEIGQAFRLYADGARNPRIEGLEKQWRADMLAQIIDAAKADQVYAGFDQYVQMSGYLPRNLLVLVKNITTWAIRYGEDPFGGEVMTISNAAMVSGVREAAQWFMRDATPSGQMGLDCEGAINRLGSLFRINRFSDRPAEVSCSAFSVNRASASDAAVSVLDTCMEHALLLEIPQGQRERNTSERRGFYQLNPMLAPLFDLASSRRGTMLLDTNQVNAIFDPEAPPGAYRGVANAMKNSLNAPFARSSGFETDGEEGLLF